MSSRTCGFESHTRHQGSTASPGFLPESGRREIYVADRRSRRPPPLGVPGELPGFLRDQSSRRSRSAETPLSDSSTLGHCRIRSASSILASWQPNATTTPIRSGSASAPDRPPPTCGPVSACTTKIAHLLTERHCRRVLDLGCGEGALRAAADKMTAPPWVVGLDASATMLSAVPPPAVRADAAEIPFADNAFDAVVAVNILDHLPDPLPALRAVHRVLDHTGCWWPAPSAAGPPRPRARCPRHCQSPNGAA
ncbi:class I SAM-dependent methyltransferase [Nocardia cyriacigeorgica]|uniref:class I SAM-dependent methyltransferase n=1 Tax=Nocardia cyriacigeorgica TaxID=135487 RepID=UPI0032C3DAA2